MNLLFAILLSVNVFAQQTAPEVPAPPPPAHEEKPVKGSIKVPKVYFVSPKDGATVKKTFKVKMGIEGMKVKPALTMDVGSGHHHIIVNGGPIPKGQVVPKDEKNIHYGKGETTAELTLEPGEHTLTLQFADGSHLSYGPELSATIKVTVK